MLKAKNWLFSEWDSWVQFTVWRRKRDIAPSVSFPWAGADKDQLKHAGLSSSEEIPLAGLHLDKNFHTVITRKERRIKCNT